MSAKGLITLLVFISSIDVRGDLGNVCQEMWNAAGNNMDIGKDLIVNTTSATNLFTLTASGNTRLSKSDYVVFKALLDKYVTAPLSSAYKPEEDAFIKAIAVVGGPVDVAFKYLKDNGKTTAKNLSAFGKELHQIWFTKYSKGKSDAIYSGFEHVFVGEIVKDKKKMVVKGLHNWYQFYLEQTAKRLVYIPPANSTDLTKQPSLIKVAYKWNNVTKQPGSSFYVGTSPTFEMALYTACFLGEPGDCTCSINGKSLLLKTIPYTDKATGKAYVLTSYPVSIINIVSTESTTTSSDCDWLISNLGMVFISILLIFK